MTITTGTEQDLVFFVLGKAIACSRSCSNRSVNSIGLGSALLGGSGVLLAMLDVVGAPVLSESETPHMWSKSN